MTNMSPEKREALRNEYLKLMADRDKYRRRINRLSDKYHHHIISPINKKEFTGKTFKYEHTYAATSTVDHTDRIAWRILYCSDDGVTCVVERLGISTVSSGASEDCRLKYSNNYNIEVNVIMDVTDFASNDSKEIQMKEYLDMRQRIIKQLEVEI